MAAKRAPPRPLQAPLTARLRQMCGEDTREFFADWPIQRIAQLVEPNAEQRAALDGLGNASVKAAQVIRAACPNGVAFTPIGRIEAMQARLEAMIRAADFVREPLDRFYDLLSDEQKARFNIAGQPGEQDAQLREILAQRCRATNAALNWPQEQIEKAVRPDAAQQEKLDGLRAAAKAAGDIAASCPAELPLTPPARLDAINKRLNAMLDAVKTVRAALDSFYAALSDEQKAQFNTIGQPRGRAALSPRPAPALGRADEDVAILVCSCHRGQKPGINDRKETKSRPAECAAFAVPPVRVIDPVFLSGEIQAPRAGRGAEQESLHLMGTGSA